MNGLEGFDVDAMKAPDWLLPTPYTDELLANYLSGLLDGYVAHTPGLGWLTWNPAGWWDQHGPRWTGRNGPRQAYIEHAQAWVQRHAEAAARGQWELNARSVANCRKAVEQTARIAAWHDTAVAYHGQTQEEWNERSAIGTINCGTRTLSWGDNPRPDVIDSTPDNSNHNHSGIDIDLIDWALHDKLVAAADDPGRQIEILIEYADHTDTDGAWAMFLVQTHPDIEDCRYVWELWGSAIYGLTTTTLGEHVNVLVGTGSNGKTVECRTLKSLLGTYWAEGPSDLIVQRPTSRTSGADSLWRFHAVRVMFFNELEAEHFNVTVIKQLASSESIMVNRKYTDQADFTNTGIVLAHANVQPTVGAASDGGFWRRLRILEYPHTVPAEKRDTGIAHGFVTAGRDIPAITTWAVAAATACHQRQSGWLAATTNMDARLELYRLEQDHISAWITEHCEVGNLEWTLNLTEAWAHYRTWIEARGHKPFAATKFESQARSNPALRHCAFTKEGGTWIVTGARSVIAEAHIASGEGVSDPWWER